MFNDIQKTHGILYGCFLLSNLTLTRHFFIFNRQIRKMSGFKIISEDN